MLLVHPGGPFWAKKDLGAWSIPKGELEDPGEDPRARALLEFHEETGTDLGDPPTRSGRRQSFPEVDRAAWFSLDEARERINPAQAAFLDRLQDTSSATSAP